MRIVYLHQYFNTPADNGSTRSYEMARRWVRDGHDVHIVTSERDGPKRVQWRTRTVAGITVHSVYVPYDNTMSFDRRIVSFLQFATLAGLRARTLHGDLIYATSTPLTIILPALAAKTLRSVPLVFEVRDLWPTLPIATGHLRNPILLRLAQALERVAYARSDAVVALSDDMASGVRAAAPKTMRILVAPNSCDTQLFDVPESLGIQYRESRPWLSDKPLLVYVGTLGFINGVGYLANLARALLNAGSDIQVAVYGRGSEEPRITAQADSLGVLGVNFHLLGSQSKREIPPILSAATVCTSLFLPIPAMEANSANKFFDALAAGRPVAINYGGWQAELLRSSGAGIVLDPVDYDRAAEELVDFVRDIDRIASASKAARSLAYTTFARDKIARDVLDLVEQVRDQRRPTRRNRNCLHRKSTDAHAATKPS